MISVSLSQLIEMLDNNQIEPSTLFSFENHVIAYNATLMDWVHYEKV